MSDDDDRDQLASDSRLFAALVAAKEAKDEAEAAKARADKAQEAAIKLFGASKRVSVATATKMIDATLIEAETLRIDDAGLFGELDADQIDRCTKRVLDRELLEACVAAKVIPREKVEAHSELVPKKPYILFKEKRRPTIKKQPMKKIGKGGR